MYMHIVLILVCIYACVFTLQAYLPGTFVLLRNSARDGRKGDKLSQRWLGPYTVTQDLGKGLYKLRNGKTGKELKKVFNAYRWVLLLIHCKI